MSNDDKFYGGLRVGAAGASAPTGSGAATPPLTAARTIHVDSALGNDGTGDGSAARPYATLARAWAERLTYGELRAALTVQLHGVGPYTLTAMGASVCDVNGYFIIRGDDAADTVAVTSTFTGDLSTTTFAVPATAGLGNDTHKGKFLVVTSGACNGMRALILSNTDTVIQLSEASVRSVFGAIVNGDTFQIRTPGTVINAPAVPTGTPPPGSLDWAGGANPSGYLFGGSALRHMFVNVSFTGSPIYFRQSAIALLGCKSVASLNYYRSSVSYGGIANSFVLGIGADAVTNLLAGYGVSTSGQTGTSNGNSIYIIALYTTGLVFLGYGDYCIWNGGRLDGQLFVTAGRFECFASGLTQVSKPMTVSNGGQMAINGGTWVFALTAGSCLDLQTGALVRLNTSPTVSGGTSDVAGYGVLARSGAKMCFQNRVPVLTGGTPGADLKAENTAAIALATLSANGQSTLDAATQAIIMRVAT